MRLRDAEIVEEAVRHIAVVMLAGVDDGVCELVVAG